MLTAFLHVALGGAIGSVLRYGVTLLALRWLGPGFPYGTLAVNVAGSFAMGVLAVAAAAHLRPLLLTGVLGGFTTFSAFALDAVGLWDRGAAVQAVLYAGLSVTVSIAALVTGAALARGFA